MKIHIQNIVLDFESPKIMGILNITPDSFYDGGKHASIDSILAHTEKMLSEGADIIDIGAYSSRPGARHVSTDEEITRIVPVAREIHKAFPNVIISIDTFRSDVVMRLFDSIGEFIVNDISGGNMDKSMFSTIGLLGLPYICMHMQGTPQTMAQQTQYKDLIHDIHQYFTELITRAESHSISQIILDPGFGFGKTTEQNFTLLSELASFTIFEKPILIGISRKSMIYKTLKTNPEDALHGTGFLHAIALMNKANILRVHDVHEAKQCITLFKNLKIKKNADFFR